MKKLLITVVLFTVTFLACAQSNKKSAQISAEDKAQYLSLINKIYQTALTMNQVENQYRGLQSSLSQAQVDRAKLEQDLQKKYKTKARLQDNGTWVEVAK